MLKSFWSNFGGMLGSFWGHFWFLELLETPRSIQEAIGSKNRFFWTPSPAKVPDKLGPFSVQDASKIDVGGVVLVTCFHQAFLLQNKRLKSPLKTRKTAKTIGGVFKNKLSFDMKKVVPRRGSGLHLGWFLESILGHVGHHSEFFFDIFEC